MASQCYVYDMEVRTHVYPEGRTGIGFTMAFKLWLDKYAFLTDYRQQCILLPSLAPFIP
jgi:hypothetical protein